MQSIISADRRRSHSRGHDESTGNQHRLATDVVDPNHGGDGSEEHPTAVYHEPSPISPEVATYTTPTTPVASSEMLLPVKPRLWKMLGA